MHGYGADICSAVDVLGSGTNGQPHGPQQPQQPPMSESKYDMSQYEESVHSDSYVSYLESDDSMTAAPLSTSTSP